MKKADAQEVKQVQIDILNKTVEFCENHGISYWLDSGTLLGAVRHKGYIPWDDDIDLGMLRPDYDKFLALFNTENTKYQAYSIENNPLFLYPHAKVLDTETVLFEPDKNGQKLSINIDIFVYDNAPKNTVLLEKQYKKRDILRKCHLARTLRHRPSGGILRRLLVYVFRVSVLPFKKNYFVLKLVENSKKYTSNETGYVGNFTAVTKMHCRKSVFDSFIDVEFEGKNYKAPVGYDEWLRAFYGDYMQLPPPEKRVSHHTYEAYVLE